MVDMSLFCNCSALILAKCFKPPVIPAQAGIQFVCLEFMRLRRMFTILDSRLRGNDGVERRGFVLQVPEQLSYIFPNPLLRRPPC